MLIFLLLIADHINLIELLMFGLLNSLIRIKFMKLTFQILVLIVILKPFHAACKVKM